MLSPTLDAVRSSVVTSGAPLLLRQGSVETVAVIESRAAVAGDADDLALWSDGDTGTGWTAMGRVPIRDGARSLRGEIAAMTSDPAAGHVFLAGEDGSIHVTDMDARPIRSLVLRTVGANTGAFAAADYIITGLAFADDALFALAGGYDDILRIDPNTGQVEAAVSLVGVTEPSGLAIRGGRAYVLQGHEYTEPSPDVAVFDLRALRP